MTHWENFQQLSEGLRYQKQSSEGATLLKESLSQVFSCVFCEILRTPFLQNTSGRLLLKYYVLYLVLVLAQWLWDWAFFYICSVRKHCHIMQLHFYINRSATHSTKECLLQSLQISSNYFCCYDISVWERSGLIFSHIDLICFKIVSIYRG